MRSQVGNFHLWIALAAAFGTAASPAAGQSVDEPLILIRMPDESPAPEQPRHEDVERFLQEHRSIVHMSVQDLERDPALAKRILGQERILLELEEFRKLHDIEAKVRFVDWGESFRYFSDYVSDPSNPPVVAQLGDTWLAHFNSLGVVGHRERFTWDVRVLWYWKDWVDPTEVADWSGFRSACLRLRESRPDGMAAPFAIGTSLNWNLLHDLSVWLYNGGLPSLISTEKKFGFVPWKQAVFAEPQGRRAAAYLIDLARDGLVDLPDRSADQIAEDFLSRKYAMAILGSWVADRARLKLGPRWLERVGVAMPPKLGPEPATTVKGGSYLVILDPSAGAHPKETARARQLVDFLAGADSQRRFAKHLGDLPGNPQALSEAPQIELFREALRRGRAYPEIREWAPVVENLTTRDNLYAFWKRLAALTDASTETAPPDRANRQKLILAALQSAQTDINRELSPGKVATLGPWLLGLAALALGVFIIAAWRVHVRKLRADARLRASEQKYRDLYDNAPDMFCSIDTVTGKIVQCNRMLVAKTGFGKEEILGRHIFEMYHPDCLEDLKKAAEALNQSGELRDVELQLKRKDGGKLDVSLNVSAVRDEQGRIIRTRSVWRDITEKKRIEQEIQQQRLQLAHVARAATLGELSASLAHELNQPLAAIVSNAQAGERLMRAEPPDLPEVADVLHDIASDGKRASEVIKRLRALLTKGSLERVAVDINQVVEEVVQLVRGEAALKSLRLRMRLNPDLPNPPGDRVQLQQAVLNLILNAAEAMDELDADCREINLRTSRPNPEFIEVSVQDCGRGIQEPELERIFDAFYSTKPNGLGMGLSITRSIVEAHGGKLWARPNPDRGVTFHFTLPVQVPSFPSNRRPRAMQQSV